MRWRRTKRRVVKDVEEEKDELEVEDDEEVVEEEVDKVEEEGRKKMRLRRWR